MSPLTDMKTPDPENETAPAVMLNGKERDDTTMMSEVAIFSSPLPITGERKTTTRVELWVIINVGGQAYIYSHGTCITLAIQASVLLISPYRPGRIYCTSRGGIQRFRVEPWLVDQAVSTT